jgi:hypothetical protein
LSEDTPHIDDAGESQHDSTDADGSRPSAPALILASVFLTAPAGIPFYYAMKQDDATLQWVFIGAGFSLVIFNAVALVLIYRWIQRINQS